MGRFFDGNKWDFFFPVVQFQIEFCIKVYCMKLEGLFKSLPQVYVTDDLCGGDE